MTTTTKPKPTPAKPAVCNAKDVKYILKTLAPVVEAIIKRDGDKSTLSEISSELIGRLRGWG